MMLEESINGNGLVLLLWIGGNDLIEIEFLHADCYCWEWKSQSTLSVECGMDETFPGKS